MARRRVTFAGRVQGVGFRATARAAALGRPVTGWVRNEPDGSVTLEVQGTPDHIERFLSDLRGRTRGLVRSEELIEIPDVDGEPAFEVIR